MRKALLNLDREAVFVANLDGGVLKREDDHLATQIQRPSSYTNTKIIKVGLASTNLERDEEAKLASGFWEFLSNVLHLEEPMI